MDFLYLDRQALDLQTDAEGLFGLTARKNAVRLSNLRYTFFANSK
jgi:hypothetical protein